MGVDNGNADVSSYHWHIHLLVTDLPAYLEALEDLMDANDGDVYMRAIRLPERGLESFKIFLTTTGTMSLLKRPSTSEPPSQMVFIKPWRLLSSLKPFKV